MAKEKRNAEIVRDREGGITYKQLGQEYGLSRERIRQICQRERRRREQQQNPFMSSLPQYAQTRLSKCLGEELLSYPQKIAQTDVREFLKIRFIGRKIISAMAQSLDSLCLLDERSHPSWQKVLGFFKKSARQVRPIQHLGDVTYHKFMTLGIEHFHVRREHGAAPKWEVLWRDEECNGWCWTAITYDDLKEWLEESFQAWLKEQE